MIDKPERPEWWDPAVADAMEWLRSTGFVVHRQTQYAKDLGAVRSRSAWPSYFEWCQAQGINPLAVTTNAPLKAWRAAMRAAGAASGTVGRRLTAVRGWYLYRSARGLMPPVANVFADAPADDLNDRTKTLSLAEARALRIAAAHRADSEMRLRNILIVDLLMVAGLRPSEVLGLDVGDLIRSAQTKRLQVVIRARGSAARHVTLPDDLADTIDRHLLVREIGRGAPVGADEPLIVTKTGARLVQIDIMRRLQRICRTAVRETSSRAERAAAEVLVAVEPRLSAQTLQRFAAVTAIEQGAPVPAVKAWLGLPSTATADELVELADGSREALSVVVARALRGPNTVAAAA